ncbi:FliC/FljB family flagellin [Escherichia coli]|uniref:FliC/FljB family flagellin n=1 Tax=Escherichia coli TaxID=562 RepID=UPI00162466D5|nr:FliC/FljB family flagellin [Escherichia coli]MCA8565607.1 FliC/FljB family flagellin [Escherichia coli]MCA8732112.1 FliC/FljB family flagellin [Escherichia coli]MCH6432165.1 FliC/FljB family flagellin [Escherichia coli]MDZ8244486.1 FliC/FljB family flagellin [Escherichia coli]HAW6057765.1 FliC/FljB family flagellin [Escherichia coli]
MAQVINTNSLSLITQNNINKNQSALSSSIERLSSGLRINSAKDDAAGQAIANRFTSNIKGLTQAARNANDGISVAQTTEGALSEINNNLQRIRELTVQATTGTNSDSDLDSIQDEIKSRLDEIDRVSGQTQFNGVNVLSKDGSMKIQVGANDGETITIDLKKIDSDTLNLAGFNVNGAGSVDNAKATGKDLTDAGFTASAADANGKITYTKDTVTKFDKATAADVLGKAAAGDSITYAGTDTGLGVAADASTYTYNAANKSYTFDATGVAKADAGTALKGYLGASNTGKINIGGTEQEVNIAKDGSITDTNGDALYLDSTGNLTKNTANLGAADKATVDKLFAGAQDATITFDSGMTAKFDQTAGTVDFKGASISADAMASTLNNGSYTANVGGKAYAVTAGAVQTGGADVYKDTTGALTTEDDETVTATYYGFADGKVSDGEGSTVYKAADGSITKDATTKSEATTDPLKALDDAISQIDKFRSSLGAVQNRLDSAVTNLNNTTTNLSEAQSRIQDADYATEVSNMSKAQIIQQAGNSVLAKANQVPQQILSLLQG